MYYPKQIPYLLDQEFKAHVAYTEHRLKSLESHCMCIWEMQSRHILDKTIYNYILPDACIDVVINFTEKTLCVAGFSRETIPFELNQKIDFMGVRMRPGAFRALFGVNADEIMDHPAPLSEIDHNAKLDQILAYDDTDTRIKIFEEYLLSKIKSAPDTKHIAIVDQLYQAPKDQGVLDLADSFGYSERQLYRLSKAYYGLSPKVLLNILRLHLCLTLMLEGETDLIEIANRCEFYDQAHFIKEIKKYTGFSPVKLLENYR